MEAVNNIRPLIFLSLCLLLVVPVFNVLVQAQSRTDRVTSAVSAGSTDEVPSQTKAAGVAMQPILVCSLSAPLIIADNVILRYVPMPFTLTVTVTNTGDMLTDSVWARIMLPKDLELAAPDIPDRHTKDILPSRLSPTQSGSATWQVKHPLTDVEKSYVVTVWVKTANADSSKCEITVTIPPLDSPILAPRCYVPASLYFDDTLDTYVPNPIPLRLTCVNSGNTNAFNVEGTIILPPDLELDPPGQPLTRLFTPSTMQKYVPPAPHPELTWTVRWTKRYRYDVAPEIRFTVTGKNFLGAQLDSTDVRCAIPVPGVQPLLACYAFDMPDSLALNAAGLDVEPNPFRVSFTIRNKGNNVGRITRLYINFPPDGLSLDPSSPNPMNQTMSLDLDKDESRTFEWIIKVENRITRRLSRITVTAIDDEGEYIVCEGWLPIANLKTAMRCDLRTSERELRYIPALGEYAPDHFVITETLTNTGGANLHDVMAEVEWTDPSGMDLVEFDPDYVDNTNPKRWDVLLPGMDQTFAWGFRLKNKNRTGVPQGLTFVIKYGSRETPFIVGGCEVPVLVDAIPAAHFDTQCSGPDTIYADTQAGVYIPKSFDVTLYVCNVGSKYADSLTATILIQSSNVRTMPGYPIVLEKGILTGTDTLGVDSCYTFRWSLEALPTDITSPTRIKFTVQASNAEPEECEITIVIPPLGPPNLAPQCYVPSLLVFDENLDAYVPNPFRLSLICVNNGYTDAFNVEGTIILPPDLVLDPPMQPVTKTFTPSTMSKYVPPAPEPKLTWTVRWKTRPRHDVTTVLCFTVTGKNFLGAPLDTTKVCCTMLVQGVPPPLLVCDALELPDSLTLNAAGTDVEPNPFTVRYTIRNIGIGSGEMKRLYISFPTSDGLSLDPSSPSPMDQTGSLGFGKDDWYSAQWIIKVQNHLVRRVPLISVTAIDDEGNPITCADSILIAGVGTVGSGSAPLPTETRLEQNRPNPFNPATTIEYHLGEASEYSLKLFDALGRMVRELESGHKQAGTYTYVLDATGLASGVYLYKLETPGFSETKRMILSR